MFVKTQNHTLHPNQNPEKIPVKKNSEYNVTVNDNECKGGAGYMNVTLTMFVSDNVLKNVQYVFCDVNVIYRYQSGQRTRRKVRSTNVYLVDQYVPTTATHAQTTSDSFVLPTTTATHAQTTSDSFVLPTRLSAVCCVIPCLVLLSITHLLYIIVI